MPDVSGSDVTEYDVSGSADTVRIPAAGGGRALAIAIAFGALVAVGLGVFGTVHEPRFFSVNLAGFSSGTAVKAWLATLAVLLGVFQLVSAFAMYRLLPRGAAPRWLATAHVWSGRLAVLVTAPVAVHCLYALGFASSDTRVLFHSLFGCFFYGVFVTKMLLLTHRRLRPWMIPLVGGLLFFSLVYVWLTSALWFFQTTGLTV